tara:strand:- start:7753 stop:7995 length:243 start_codon:yes stop_codon:yes gene_type:complete
MEAANDQNTMPEFLRAFVHAKLIVTLVEKELCEPDETRVGEFMEWVEEAFHLMDGIDDEDHDLALDLMESLFDQASVVLP